MPSAQQWVYTDIVSGETQTLETAGVPLQWAVVDADVHGPLGLYIIAQRLINQVITGKATYQQVTTTPYDAASPLDSGYTIPTGLQSQLRTAGDS
jgi:hypothetical protein